MVTLSVLSVVYNLIHTQLIIYSVDNMKIVFMPHLVWGIHEHYHITNAIKSYIRTFAFILQRTAEVYQTVQYFILTSDLFTTTHIYTI